MPKELIRFASSLLLFINSICLCFVITPFIKDHNRHLYALGDSLRHATKSTDHATTAFHFSLPTTNSRQSKRSEHFPSLNTRCTVQFALVASSSSVSFLFLRWQQYQVVQRHHSSPVLSSPVSGCTLFLRSPDQQMSQPANHSADTVQTGAGATFFTSTTENKS